MRTRTISALALALAAAAAHPAVAGSSSTYSGDCHMMAVNDPVGVLGGTMVFNGWMQADVTVSSPNPADNPVSAIVTCWVQFPSAPAVYGDATQGTGSVHYWQLLSFVAVPGTTVDICTEVDFLDSTPTATSCITTNSIVHSPTQAAA